MGSVIGLSFSVGFARSALVVVAMVGFAAWISKDRGEGIPGVFRASLIPTVDALKSLEPVYIPGMMSGMILGGANPTYAAEYQFVITAMLFAAGGLTSVLSTSLIGTYAFTDAEQLKSLGDPGERTGAG